MGWSLLIVDDDADFRAGARALLEVDGFRVLGEAADGESALEAAQRLRPEAVLLDIQLPGMDGFAVAERLAAGDDPPLVVLTSSRDGADYGRGIEHCGASGFVPKGDLSGAAIAALLPA